jgi:putative PIN family toxin of toxin-antitoxin system
MDDSDRLRVVFDTSVLVAAARSRRGASFALVNAIPSPIFVPCLSIALYAEWQDVLLRPENVPAGQTRDDVLAYLSYLANQSVLQEIHFSWRPLLPDVDDEMVLELAVAAGCSVIITHNVGDFRGSERLGVEAILLRDFLARIRRGT